ncbi:mitochondrial inner-membrane-bound regulator-domain-containing protein [Bombardia bombarda]|uniref:Mitochondrial inner-membrane-bound regulator-domain-containing protein n=1 Tax=Bombardia bombarda TaxID=252184 RepID=A0AA39X7G5_9PEZI|nr:mitochondrial inner-membrane-bound regulator-domain-containing protein [Bombardia bombarda]
MLGRKAAHGFVCLRCRLQLGSVAARRPTPSSLLPKSHSLLLTSVALSRGRQFSSHYNTDADAATATATTTADAAAAPNPFDAAFSGDVDSKDTKPLDNTSEKNGDKPRIRRIMTAPSTLNVGRNGKINYHRVQLTEALAPYSEKRYKPPSPRPAEHNYFNRGDLMRPRQTKIAVDILGKPGSAIIMERERPEPLVGVPSMAPQPAPDMADLEKAIQLHDIDSGADDATLNLHELRPAVSKVLSKKEFDDLWDTLTNGFTVAQLDSYMSKYLSAAAQLREEARRKNTTAHPWVLERKLWVAANRDGSRPPLRANLLLQDYVTASTSPKAKLVARLMRECWDLSTREVGEKMGFLDVKLRDIEFSLVQVGKRWLGQISEKYQASGMRIALSLSTNTMTITAPEQVAELVLYEINHRLKSARRISFDASLISDQPVSRPLLKEVADITKTVIYSDASTNQIHVCWVPMTSPSIGFEDLGDVVFRFLLQACGRKPRESSATKVLPKSSIQCGRYVDILDAAPKLEWHKRTQSWARWIAPITTSDLSQAETLTLPRSILPVLPTNKATKKKITTSQPHDGWSSQMHADTRAVYGHVLLGSSASSYSRNRLVFNGPRAFVPKVPPLRSLGFPAASSDAGIPKETLGAPTYTPNEDTSIWYTTLVLRFIPTPYQAPDILASAPVLELRIEADGEMETKRLVSLRAVTDIFNGDVLIPAGPVDVRIQQERYFSLDGADLGQHAAPVLDFVNRSQLEPWNGKLNTPPNFQGMPIPRRFLKGELANTTTTATTTDANDDVVGIDYMLIGIEDHRVIAADYQGFKLAYRSVEAGRRGGKREEVSLDAAASDDMSPAEAKSKQAEFMTAASRLAAGDGTFQWQQW